MAKYVIQQPYSFQDDVLIPVVSVEAIRAANLKMTTVMKTLSEKKLGYIQMGPRHLVEAARIQATLNPEGAADREKADVCTQQWTERVCPGDQQGQGGQY